MMDNAEPSEDRLFATFDKHEQFADFQRSFLTLDVLSEPDKESEHREYVMFKDLREILDEYQEQAYLLDPYLEELVTPVVTTLRIHAKAMSESKQGPISKSRIGRVAHLLYYYIKIRGYKTITKFFPHEIADLSIALEYMILPESPVHTWYNWPLRYVVLLWLSLICMIPFDFEQFDERDQIGRTAEQLEALGKSYLDKAGLEREGAAILLSKFYTRRDTSSRFSTFLEWSASVTKLSKGFFASIGSLRVLCEVAQAGSVDQVKLHVATLLDIGFAVQDNEALMSNNLVRKLRAKLIARVALRLLPAKSNAMHSKGRLLTDIGNKENYSASLEDDIDVPAEVEGVLEELFKAVQDKDTIVRWSVAKGIARISERLPSDFIEQVLETVISLFSIHSIAAASIYDMPSIAEGTWHGTCLTCAEMARRGLVSDDKLSDLIDWLCKALYFDIRKGAHSIGSNVRDAACYVLWSLARAQRIAALSPHAENLSRRLVVVSLFDREIHVRRAASATFQEFVGRTSLFPHGIDVLRKTDFYAVGIRRNSFLVAAPEVAQHEEYRLSLVDHLLTVTLRHWDAAMRSLGAQSLRAICQLDLARFGPDATLRASEFVRGPEVGDIHGALVALTEMAAAFRDSDQDLEVERRKVFGYLLNVPMDVIESPRHELVTAVACELIANGITRTEIEPEETSVPHWRKIVDVGLRSRSTTVQEAAAAALAAVSKLVNCSAIVDRLIREFRTGSPSMQQSLCRVLGVLDYNVHPHGLSEAIRCLLSCVGRSGSTEIVSIEARRNACISMPQILENVAPRLPEQLAPAVVCAMLDALLDGLTDYTSDERGDVGSWVRIACLKGLIIIAETLFPLAEDLPNFPEYFPASKYHNAVGGILKQGVERLDNVRQHAGDCFMRSLLLPLPKVPDTEAWRIHGEALFKDLFLSDAEKVSWQDGERLFPRAVRLLEIESYREAVLSGLIMSVSTKTDSTQRPVSKSLVAYAKNLPLTTTVIDKYDLRSLTSDLLARGHRNLNSNSIIVPVLQTFNVLLEGDALDLLPDDPIGLQSLKGLLSIAAKNVGRLKSLQRIAISSRIVINLLPTPQLREECISQLPSFLGHQYPKIRTDTAEHLYLILQSRDFEYETDDVEDVLLETEWSSADTASLHDAAGLCVRLLRDKHTA